MTTSNLFSITQAAEFLGVSISTLRRWDEAGKLKPILTDGGHRRYHRENLEQYSEKTGKNRENFPKLIGQNTFVFDFDSTVFPGETLDELIQIALKNDPKKSAKISEMKRITDAGMNGEISFVESLKKRLSIACITYAHLKTYHEENKNRIDKKIRKIFDFLREKKQIIYIISGGMRSIITPIATEQLGLMSDQILGNECIFQKNAPPTLTQEYQHKSDIIRNLQSTGQAKNKIIMIGDGANDVAVYESKSCDYFIGFGGYVHRESTESIAPFFAKNIRELHKIIFSFFLS